MKPQTGILISVHSYSKQYIQFYESQCATDSHTGGFVVKVPDIQQYIYTSIFYVTSLGRGWLGAKYQGCPVTVKGKQNIQMKMVCPRLLLQQSSQSPHR